jgi:hypothetical protein
MKCGEHAPKLVNYTSPRLVPTPSCPLCTLFLADFTVRTASGVEFNRETSSNIETWVVRRFEGCHMFYSHDIGDGDSVGPKTGILSWQLREVLKMY